VNTNNHWHHLVYTCSATSSATGTGKIYLDGVHQSGIDFTAPALNASADTDRFIVGARNISFSNKISFLDANVDELSCWNRVLSQAEITALYNDDGYGHGTPTDILNTPGVTPDPVAWYRMGDGAGAIGVTVADQIGSADLTMQNGPTFSTVVP
jgi:hypothetical protein